MKKFLIHIILIFMISNLFSNNYKIGYLGFYTNSDDLTTLNEYSRNFDLTLKAALKNYNVEIIPLDSILKASSNKSQVENIRQKNINSLKDISDVAFFLREEILKQHLQFLYFGFVDHEHLSDKKYSYPLAGIYRFSHNDILPETIYENYNNPSSRSFWPKPFFVDLIRDRFTNKLSIKYRDQAKKKPPQNVADTQKKNPKKEEYTEIQVLKLKLVILDLQSYNIDKNTSDELNSKIFDKFSKSGLFLVSNRKNLDSLLRVDDYQRIGKLEKADKIVTGSIGKLGDILSITLKLIDVATGSNDEIMNYRQNGNVQDLFHIIDRFFENILQLYDKLTKKDRKKQNKETTLFNNNYINSYTREDYHAPSAHNKKLNSMEIQKLFEFTKYIELSDRFTDPLTNMYTPAQRGVANYLVRPYDFLDITKGLVIHEPLFHFSNDSVNRKYHNLKFTSDKFLNNNSATEFSSRSFYSKILNKSKKIEDSFSISFNFKISGRNSEKFDLITLNSNKEFLNIDLDKSDLIFILKSNFFIKDVIKYNEIKPNIWYHVVLTVDMVYNTASLYINNELKTEKRISFSTTDLSVGELMVGSQDNILINSSVIVNSVRFYDRILNNSEVHCLYYEKDWKQKALVVHLPFNNKMYEETRTDYNYYFSSKTEYCPDRSGFQNCAVQFISDSSMIQYASLTDINLYHHFTISLWFNLSKNFSKNNCLLIYKYNQDANSGFQISIIESEENSYKIQFTLNGETIVSDHVFKKEEWNNTCVTYNEGQVALYSNGQKDKVSEFEYTIRTNSKSLYLGRSGYKFQTNTFRGSIDDVRIFYRALSDDEIKLLYEE